MRIHAPASLVSLSKKKVLAGAFTCGIICIPTKRIDLYQSLCQILDQSSHKKLEKFFRMEIMRLKTHCMATCALLIRLIQSLGCAFYHLYINKLASTIFFFWGGWGGGLPEDQQNKFKICVLYHQLDVSVPQDIKMSWFY